MMCPLAQVYIEVNPQTPAAAEEYGGAIGGKPRPVGANKQIGLQIVA
jgi:hypothetical protein